MILLSSFAYADSFYDDMNSTYENVFYATGFEDGRVECSDRAGSTLCTIESSVVANGTYSMKCSTPDGNGQAAVCGGDNWTSGESNNLTCEFQIYKVDNSGTFSVGVEQIADVSTKGRVLFDNSDYPNGAVVNTGSYTYFTPNIEVPLGSWGKYYLKVRNVTGDATDIEVSFRNNSGVENNYLDSSDDVKISLVDYIHFFNSDAAGTTYVDSIVCYRGDSLVSRGGTPPTGNLINVTIDSPFTGVGYTSANIAANGSKIYITATHNATGAWTTSVNDTDWTLNSNTSTTVTFLNNTAIADGTYHIALFVNKTGTANGTDTVYFTIDTTEPSIIPRTDLLNNQSIVYNGTFATQINFTDNLEIYSINVSFANGTVIYDGTNLGITAYSLNVSYGVGNTQNDYLTARTCDAHTALSISDIENRVENQGIKYIIENNPLWFKDEWVHIYPKSFLDYSIPNTIKENDRYVFTFNKNILPTTETFVVESSHYIDIAKMQLYGGHLIVPDIGKNGYWIDFENKEATSYSIKRISDTKIEITVYGLKDKQITFNSIGELNCVTKRYYFGNLAPEQSFREFVLVGDSSTFYLNITKDTETMTTVNATLYYNNTAYSDTTDNFSISITAPTTISTTTKNISFNWVVDVDGTKYNFTTYNQNVSNFYIDNCTLYSTHALNFTVNDEENGSVIIADIEGTFNYISNNIYKSYTFDLEDWSNFSICIFPAYASLNTNYTLYYSSYGYPQRRYYDDKAINNVSSNVPLYLLSSSLGIYVRFSVVDSDGDTLSGVKVTMERNIDGSLVIVEQENTDDSGLATFWVNPDKDYVFTFNKTGYDVETFTLRPTSSEIYTVTLGGGLVQEEQPTGTGIAYKFYPSNKVLNNNTAYTFSFNMTSSYWDITGCTLYLKNDTATISQSSTTYTTSTCDISINYNTNDQTKIISEAEYQLNITRDSNVSVQYSIQNTYKGEFSLKNFIDDLKAFGGAGFNDFTRMFIAFIIIFAIVASVANGMGLREPEPLIILTLFLILAFSYIGWLTLNYDSIPEFVFTPEGWLKQYIIFILSLFAGGSYLINRWSG